MKINDEILDILKEFNIRLDDGICYLISLYHNYNPSYIPDELKRKINITKIVEVKNKTLQWNVSLYNNQETKFDWVKTEYCKLFKEHNPELSGYHTDSIRRMKKFFANNPEYRKDDIINATRLYLNNTEPTYTRRPHYFIEKGKGVEKTSDLLVWLEKYKLIQEQGIGRSSVTNTLQ